MKANKAQTSKASFWKRPVGMALLTALSLAATYLAASLAINSGSLWEYALAVITLAYSLRQATGAVREVLSRG